MIAPRIVLCADDYAMTDGISQGIEALALARRLSAASAMVTTRHWPAHGARLAHLRGDIATGLHLNLTLGAPLGSMPNLAPEGRLPVIATLIARALSARLDRAEIAAEIARQITAFTAAVGHPPDFLDGHQHAHALPIVRRALVDALQAAALSPPPLVRSPGDSPRRIASRGLYPTKSLVLAGLARGFARLLDRHGLPRNATFSGVSAFDRASPYARELARAFAEPGALHLVMCHPGHPDAELSTIDPVVARRRDEFDALMAHPDLPALIWHPARTADGPPVDWGRL